MRKAANLDTLQYRAKLITQAPYVDYITYGNEPVIEFFDARDGKTIKRGKLRAGETWQQCYSRLFAPRPWFSLRKVGGIWHWRIGRIGGSFYASKGV